MLQVIGTPLEQASWQNMLVMESKMRDVYQDFSGTFSDNKQRLPNGIRSIVNLAPSATKHTIGLLLNLDGEGVTGRTDQIGKEKDQELKEMEVYSNDVSNAVNTQKYGIDAHSKEGYKILEKVNPQLSLWHQEIEGKYTREGLLERVSSNLTVAPVSQVKRWNENILIKGVTLANQPAYDSTNATYESNFNTAATGGAGGVWDIVYLDAIIYYITVVKKIEAMDNGRYIVTVPSRQAMFLKSAVTSGSIANTFKDSHVPEAANNSYKQWLGSYGILDLYEDTRNAVVNLTSGDMVAQYKGAGKDDDRYTLGTGVDYDVGFVHGKGSYFKAIHDPIHFEEEFQNYGKVVGVGAFAGYGINRTVFDDVGSENDTSEINQNSVALFAVTNIAAV